jgi:hypothetical protein
MKNGSQKDEKCSLKNEKWQSKKRQKDMLSNQLIW